MCFEHLERDLLYSVRNGKSDIDDTYTITEEELLDCIRFSFVSGKLSQMKELISKGILVYDEDK